jgi:site-specific DNA recombinase
VSFVSVTQQFNTTSSMGRLTLNVLVSFARFEREVTGERIRDKIAASKKKGVWMGGNVPLGYDVNERSSSTLPRPRRYAASSLSIVSSAACAGQGGGRPSRASDEMQHDNEWHRARQRGGKPFSRGHL